MIKLKPMNVLINDATCVYAAPLGSRCSLFSLKRCSLFSYAANLKLGINQRKQTITRSRTTFPSMQLFAGALVCVWERKQRKQSRGERKKTWVTIGNGQTPYALKGNTLPSRRFVPIYLLRFSQTLLCVGLLL